MAKFEFLYSGGNQPEGEDEHAKMIKAWTAWFSDLGSAVADPGNPFGPVAKKYQGMGQSVIAQQVRCLLDIQSSQQIRSIKL